jgi:hypothetical protein
MMHEKKRRNKTRQGKKRKEKGTEAKQIAARKPKRNKSKKKKSNITSLDGNRTRHPFHPCQTGPIPATYCHPLPHLAPTTTHTSHSHIPSPISHIPKTSSYIQHPTSNHIHIHIHIHISRITHTHPQQITRSIYTPCCSMNHRPEATHTMEA